MNAKLRIPTSQRLRFVNKTYYTSTPNRWDTRLLADLQYEGKVCVDYKQEIEIGEKVTLQYRTTYSNVVVSLVRVHDNLVMQEFYSQLIHKYVDIDGDIMSVYNIDCTPMFTGDYFIRVEALASGMPYIVFESEPLKYVNESDMRIVKWGGNTTIADGIRWGDTPYEVDTYQSLRIRGRIMEITFGTDKSTYVDSANELSTLSAFPNATHTLEVAEIPYYIVERINLGLQHDEFYIDDMMFNIDESFDFTQFKERGLSTGTIPLVQVVYENYSVDEVLVGDIPIIPDEFRTTGLEDRTTGLTERKINN